MYGTNFKGDIGNQNDLQVDVLSREVCIIWLWRHSRMLRKRSCRRRLTICSSSMAWMPPSLVRSPRIYLRCCLRWREANRECREINKIVLQFGEGGFLCRAHPLVLALMPVVQAPVHGQRSRRLCHCTCPHQHWQCWRLLLLGECAVSNRSFAISRAQHIRKSG